MDDEQPLAPAYTLKRLGMAKVNAFFQHLGRTGSVTLAAARAGLRRSTLYHLRKHHSGFAERWQEALDMGVERLQDDAMRRAIEGVDKPVWRAGKQVGSVRHFDPRMVQFLLRAHKPDVYGDRAAQAKSYDDLSLAERLDRAEKRAQAHRESKIGREMARLEEERIKKEALARFEAANKNRNKE